MQPVVWWEVFVNYAQEEFSHFCGNIFTTWVERGEGGGVKPNDFSFALL